MDDETEQKIFTTVNTIENILSKQTLFSSFCTNKFKGDTLINYGFLRSRMWSQYGEGHEGICLVFSKKAIAELLKSKFPSDDYLVLGDDVDYKEDLDEGTRYHSLNVNRDTFNDNTPENLAFKHINQYYKELFFRKQKDYEDENEYRFIVLQKKYQQLPEDELFFTVTDCLKCIILGDRFPDVYNPTVENICEKFNIVYKQLEWDSRGCSLLNVIKS